MWQTSALFKFLKNAPYLGFSFPVSSAWARDMRNHFSALLWSVYALISLTSCLVTEIYMAGYWEGRSTSSRNALFAVAIQFITSLCLQYERYSAFIISATRGRRWRQRYRKTRFLFGSSSFYGIKCSMLFTGNQSFPKKFLSISSPYWLFFYAPGLQ